MRREPDSDTRDLLAAGRALPLPGQHDEERRGVGRHAEQDSTDRRTDDEWNHPRPNEDKEVMPKGAAVWIVSATSAIGTNAPQSW